MTTATVDDRIVMTDLVKRYGARTVVKGVSADVRRGEVVGLLGPNGAGKTTTFYMVVGLVRPDSGSVALVRAGASRDITGAPMHERARAGIGYLAQENSIFRKLSVGDNLRLIWEMNGVEAGEREEPFTGIDPIAVADIQAMIRQLRDRGLGILITDHQVRETLAIVDRAYILNDGKIEVSGTADDVLASPIARKFYLGEGFRL